ncbi:MAG: hypothetical protein KAJ63_16620 [Methyloprofundus sp.]|nr:hypothetical protein [Methyloprofundus sp.]
MSTLTISDLSLDNELDAKAMTEVSGGMKKYPNPGLPGMGHRRKCHMPWARRRPVNKYVTNNNQTVGTAIFSQLSNGQTGGTSSLDVNIGGDLTIFA